jgi:DNA-binding transcriptional LysR family regulator
MVEAGLGVAILPELAAPAADHPALATRLLTAPGIDRTIILVRRRDRSLSPAADAFFGLVAMLFADTR